MRHNKSINHLGRTSAHRKAMLSNMSSSLIMHKRITTTVAKAKALKKYVEPLITKAKEDTTHNRRIVFSYLEDKQAVSELFREVVVKVGDRPGGYTRILRTGTRLGDRAEMCIIELVDYNEAMLEAKDSKKKSRRSRRSKTTATKTEAPVAEVKEEVETPVEEVKDEVVEEVKEEKVEEFKEEKVEKKEEVKAEVEKPAEEVKEEPKEEENKEDDTEK
ncbi:MAG: 50S ribosomal protein L17 [Marinilabiliales bacterium]|nr:MAG: 50S ribosomal protein L17 [Marinilabiliales bacterium]